MDDAVFGFEHEAEAHAFLKALCEQVEACGLTLHSTKTRLLEFGRFATGNRKKRGETKPETFDYLGFTHICGKTRNGKFCIKRITKGRCQSYYFIIRRFHGGCRGIRAAEWLFPRNGGLGTARTCSRVP
ncbi:MAG: hypothetical protein HN403_20605 [Rhodospirillales bacterium]|nr:hypothetical protein [Rhodospirillales bacterium]